MIKINVGCGAGWEKEGWIGIDYDETASIWGKQTEGSYINCNVLNGLPFEDESVDIIYASHVLEHFTFAEAHLVLIELNRVLREDGILALIVPDMDFFVDCYVKRNEKMLRTRDIVGGEIQSTLSDNFLMNFYSDPGFNNTCHKYAYCYENLEYLLKKCNYFNIQKCEFQKFKYDLEINETAFRPLPEHADIFSLCVECKKEKKGFDYEKIEGIWEIKNSVTLTKGEESLKQIIQTLKIQEVANKRYIEDLIKENTSKENEIRRYKENSREVFKDYELLYGVKTISEYNIYFDRKKICIFGAGDAGKLVYNLWGLNKHENVCFVDNDKSKRNGYCLGCEVREPYKIGEEEVMLVGFLNNDMFKINMVVAQLKRLNVDLSSVYIVDMDMLCNRGDM